MTYPVSFNDSSWHSSLSLLSTFTTYGTIAWLLAILLGPHFFFLYTFLVLSRHAFLRFCETDSVLLFWLSNQSWWEAPTLFFAESSLCLVFFYVLLEWVPLAVSLCILFSIWCIVLVATVLCTNLSSGGLYRFLPASVQASLFQTTLLESLTGSTWMEKLEKYRPFILPLSQEEVELSVRMADPAFQQQLVRKGIIFSFPRWLQEALLPQMDWAAVSSATEGVEVPQRTSTKASPPPPTPAMPAARAGAGSAASDSDNDSSATATAAAQSSHLSWLLRLAGFTRGVPFHDSASDAGAAPLDSFASVSRDMVMAGIEALTGSRTRFTASDGGTPSPPVATAIGVDAQGMSGSELMNLLLKRRFLKHFLVFTEFLPPKFLNRGGVLLVCAAVAQLLLSRGNRQWTASVLRRSALTGAVVGAIGCWGIAQVQRYGLRQVFSSFSEQELEDILPDKELLQQCKESVACGLQGGAGASSDSKAEGGDSKEGEGAGAAAGGDSAGTAAGSNRVERLFQDAARRAPQFLNSVVATVWRSANALGNRYSFATRMVVLMWIVALMAVWTKRLRIPIRR